jgi:hypothetical protein
MLNSELIEVTRRIESMENKTLFFLGGVVKSGTTWVERIYDAHPNSSCKGEAHFGSLLAPAVSAVVDDYNSTIEKQGNWNLVSQIEQQSGSPIEFQYDVQDKDFLFRQAILLMMQKWLITDDIQCVGEKTPSNQQYFPILQQLFPQAKFIYIIRDIRDVVVSGWFFNTIVNVTQNIENNKNMEHFATKLARSWDKNVRASLGFIHQSENNGMFIQYEDLLEDSLKGIQELYEFLGLACDELILASVHKQTSFNKLSGGRDSGEENRRSFYRKGTSGDWKNHLSEQALSNIENECGELMELLGYTDN